MALEFEICRVRQLSSTGWRDFEAVGLISHEALKAAYKVLAEDNNDVWQAYKRSIAAADHRDVMADEGMAATLGVTRALRQEIYPSLSPIERTVIQSGFLILLSQLAREDLRPTESQDLEQARLFVQSDGVASQLADVLRRAAPAAWTREVQTASVPPGLREGYFEDFGEMFRILNAIPSLHPRNGPNTVWTLVAFLQLTRERKLDLEVK